MTLRVGVLTPHAAAGPETELPDMSSGRVAALVARIRPSETTADPSTTPPTTPAGLRALTHGPALDRAVMVLLHSKLDVVAYASTSTSFVLGHRAEVELAGQLGRRCGVPVVSSGSAAVAAMRAGGSGRVALVHPPWFDDEVDALGARYFRVQGFDVVLVKATGLPVDPARVRPEQVVVEVARHLDEKADTVFLAGNGFRAAGAIDELERRTGRLVLTANQVLLWSVLAVTGTAWDVVGYGRLFANSA